MKYLTTIVIFISLALWPLSLLLTNGYRDIPRDFANYFRHSILAPDQEAPLIINTKRSLYPNDFVGRFFNNKATFVWGRFKANFFALTDPNNYFFGFHPREIVRENLNLDKFPFISIIFLLYGLYRLNLLKRGRGLLLLFVVLACLLSLANFDKVDFILYPVLAVFIIHGTRRMRTEKPKLFVAVAIFLVIFSSPQYLRAFVNLHP